MPTRGATSRQTAKAAGEYGGNPCLSTANLCAPGTLAAVTQLLTAGHDGVILLTPFASGSCSMVDSDGKLTALRQAGALHPRPQAVTDPLFAAHPFFDAR